MTSQDEVFEHRVRGLVSLEGDTDAISVQLRLLPPSPKIMVLLPLSSEIKRPHETTDFNARSYTRLVYEILSKRIDKARSFLKSSLIHQPRLVFMNGGCLSARMICISTICEKITKGDIVAAEMLFDDIVKDGVAGLLNQPSISVKKIRKQKKELKHETPSLNVTKKEISPENHQKDMVDQELDPVTAALKAADILYRETAYLQPSMWDDLEVTKATDMIADIVDTSWDISQDLLEFRTAVKVDVKDGVKARKILLDSRGGTSDAHRQARSGSNSRQILAKPEKRFSLPPSFPLSNFEGACVFDPQSSHKTITRSQSVGSPSSMTSFIPTREASARFMKPIEPVKSTKSGLVGGKPLRSSRAFKNSSRTSCVKSPEIKLDGILQDSTSKSQNIPDHDHQSTNAQDLGGSRMTNAVTNHDTDIDVPAQFRPLFAIVEELVVHVSAGEENKVFDSVVRSYKHSSCVNAGPHDGRILRQPVSPTSFRSTHDSKFSSRSLNSVDTDEDNVISHRRNIMLEDTSQGRRTKKREGSAPNTSSTHEVGLPDLDRPELSCHVRESTSTITNAIGVQNSIRALLNVHFPAKSAHYRQHIFPLENDRFWKPVFSNDNYPRNESRTVELMLALGIEEGVDKKFCKDIADRVEKLGIDGAHGNRIRKLDIRYLVIHAMETFTSQPLTFQAGENPFKQPSLLATLMIPHLETFLSCNEPTSVLLLYYPPSHLATVLALRELVGSEMMKVAGLVNSLPHLPDSNRNSYASITSRFSTYLQVQPGGSQISNRKSHQGAMDPQPFSKADFLLPSSATDSQISQFLSSIFLTLPDRGSLYLPSTTTPSPSQSKPQIQPLKPLSSLKEFSIERAMSDFPSPPRTVYSPSGQPLLPTGLSRNPANDIHRSPLIYQIGQLQDKQTRTAPDDSERLLRKELKDSTEDVARMIGWQISKEMLETANERLRRERKLKKDWPHFYMEAEVKKESDEWQRSFIPQMTVRATTPQKALRWLGIA